MASQSTVGPDELQPPPDEPEAGYDPVAMRRQRRRRLLLLGAAAAGSALLAVGVVYGPTSVQILQQRNTALTPPDESAGLHRDTSAEAEGTADYLRTALAAGMSLNRTVGAVYTDQADPSRSVIFVGGTGVLRNPETDLDRLFELVMDETTDVTNLAEVAPGPLGGVMKCGASLAEGAQLALCGWADHGSVAVALFPGRAPVDAVGLFRTMRGDIERR